MITNTITILRIIMVILFTLRIHKGFLDALILPVVGSETLCFRFFLFLATSKTNCKLRGITYNDRAHVSF